MNDIIIKVENLSKIYKLYDKPIERLKESLSLTKKKYHNEHFALKDISLEIQKGEILGILGTNGSGKSTLLKIITGVLTPTSGQIVTNGTISALLELGAGFNPEYTGIENIYLYGTMMNKSKEEVDKELQGILDFADIGEFIHQPVKTYSSGMFARLAFSVAINVNPDILIVDEILSVGDQKFQIKCLKKMKEMMNNGTTVLFVAHDITVIKRFCTKVVWIDKGSIIEEGDVDRITDTYMDFLKVGSMEEISSGNQRETSSNGEDEDIEPFADTGNLIAEIKKVKILNRNQHEVLEFRYDEKITLEVTYDVYDIHIKNPVLGMAIRTIDNEYMCGLNTLLDEKKIPWMKGRNKFSIEFTRGILALGGKYYFDVALFEETATVPIQYLSKVKNFTVLSEYIGEGRYVIPHEWKQICRSSGGVK